MSAPSRLRASHLLYHCATLETLSKSLIFSFLAPSIGSSVQTSRFSTTSPNFKRTRDRSRNRGVSALRRTGPRHSLSVSKEPLPQPVLDPKKRSKVQVDEDHGLWQFFKDKKALSTPEECAEHGRSWTVEELRIKSWEDLHSLWWVCAKERNRLHTQISERKRLKAGYGEFEEKERERARSLETILIGTRVYSGEPAAESSVFEEGQLEDDEQLGLRADETANGEGKVVDGRQAAGSSGGVIL